MKTVLITGATSGIGEACAHKFARNGYNIIACGYWAGQFTGGTAIGYIHSFIVNQGKNLLMRGYSISETAYRLGFEYPHHFSRIFKKVSGMTPREFIGVE